MPNTVLLRNGTVYSPADPFATAMLVVDDRIAWVGSEGAAETHVDAADEVVDVEGALVTPAFVDAHVHILWTALSEHGVDMAGARSLTDFLERVAAYARAHPGEPVDGQGWNEHDWPEKRRPTLAEIDRATNGAPAYLARVDGHSALVSSALLDRVPGVTEADGYHDGLVQRAAQRLARRTAQDSLPPDVRRRLHREALQRAASLGIGAVHEMAAPHITSPEDLASLVDLADSEPLPDVVPYWGELEQRATERGTSVGPSATKQLSGVGIERARKLGARGVAGDLSVDGSLGSRSARLTEPYADDPSSRGSLYIDQDSAAAHVIACTKAGLQAGFHCIGDEAIRVAVTAISRAAAACGLAEVVAARHRLEHVEILDLDLIPELARLGVVASVQPAFDALWGGVDGMYATRLGPERAIASNPFAALARAGVTLALGSDSPVTPLGGWDGVRAAAYHHALEQRMSVRGAFSAATRGGWRAAKVDDAGALAPGTVASYAIWDVPSDLVVHAPDDRVAAWSTDPRSGVPGLPDLSAGVPLPVCLRTVVRGRVVFDRRGWSHR